MSTAHGPEPSANDADTQALFYQHIRLAARRLAAGTYALGGVSIGAGLAVAGLAPFIAGGISAAVAQQWLENMGTNVLAGWLGNWAGKGSEAVFGKEHKNSEALFQTLISDFQSQVVTNAALQGDVEQLLGRTDAVIIAVEELQDYSDGQRVLLGLIRDDLRRGDLIAGRLHRTVMEKLSHLEARLNDIPVAVWNKQRDEVRAIICGARQPTRLAATHQLRPPMPYFVGREREIALVVQHFEATVGNPWRAAVATFRGEGGMGKNELAVAVAWQLRHIFTDADILVDLRDNSTAVNDAHAVIRRVVHAIQPDADIPVDLSDATALYRSVLHDKHVLILVLEFQGGSDIQDIVPPPGCGLLVTGRLSFGGSGALELDVGRLTLKESIDLLLKICPRIGKYAPDLAALCEGYPLLVHFVATTLERHKSRTVPQYIGRLRTQNPFRMGLLGSALEVNYELLQTADKKVFCNMSLLPVRFTILQAQTLFEIITRMSPDETEQSLENIAFAGLIRWEEESSCYAIHPTVRHYASLKLMGEESA